MPYLQLGPILMLLIFLFLASLASSTFVKSVLHISPTIRSHQPSHTLSSISESTPAISLKINSKHSYVQDFFNFITPIKLASKEVITSIKNYEDSVADDKNLKKFTELIILENEADDFDDIHNSYKKFSKSRKSTPKKVSGKKLNMEDFKKYLKDEKHFSDSDLEFLDNNLNYGFEEIDEELRKIDRSKNKASKNIKIGGEFDSGTVKIMFSKWLFFGLIIVHHINIIS